MTGSGAHEGHTGRSPGRSGCGDAGMTRKTAPERCPGYTCNAGRQWYEARRDTDIAPGEYPPGHFWYAEGGYMAHGQKP